ncbi:MAG: hypothetical protein ACK5SH_04675 [Pseudomonadota bacterium]
MRSRTHGPAHARYLSDIVGGDDAMGAVRMSLRMSSTTYRIATGPHAGRKVASLQTLPAGCAGE